MREGDFGLPGANELSHLFSAVGQLQGKLDLVIDDLKEAPEHRRRLHEKFDTIGKEVHSLRSEVSGLSDRVEAMEPSWKDYLNKQQQIHGAGRLGKALWWLGGFVLASAAWLYSMPQWLAGLLSGHNLK